MAKKKKEDCKVESKCGCTSGSCCWYGMGWLGAAIYFNVTTVGFWVGVWGCIKAIAWPAFLVFEAFKYFSI